MGKAEAVKTPIGYIPTAASLNIEGMNVSETTINELLRVDHAAWMDELEFSWLFFESLGERFPEVLWQELSKLMDRLRVAEG
jgi:phosphoenolpyruvate carboxykinase (GTP)